VTIQSTKENKENAEKEQDIIVNQSIILEDTYTQMFPQASKKLYETITQAWKKSNLPMKKFQLVKQSTVLIE
jgi:hypothetical protein